MLKLINARLGFANNSSSSHSILLCNALEHGEVDKLVDYELSDGEPYFGWESFVCASPEAKAKYFACQLAEVMRRDVGEEIAGLTVKALFGVPEKFGKGTVDHESVFELPHYPDETLAIAFIREVFQEAIDNPRVVVGGGNDNDENSNPLNAVGTKHPWLGQLGTDGYRKNLIVRPEPYGWCLFNKETGARIRLEREGVTNNFPDTPELVDICITKYCCKSCTFCYQDCNYKGKHADTQWLGSLAWILKDHRVFEVVLGGGEPTEHPDFLRILGGFRNENIIPNFTTANARWLHEPGFVAEVVKKAGSIAFSCHSTYDVEHFGRLILLAGEELAKKAVLQSVVGIVAPAELKKMIAMAQAFGFEKYSLVGFKQTGRAPEKIPHDIADYKLASFLQKTYMRFYADTALLNLCPEIVEKYTCDVTEGKQSMYIDAVNKTMQESSYTGTGIAFERKDFPAREEILSAFHKFQRRA